MESGDFRNPWDIDPNYSFDPPIDNGGTFQEESEGLTPEQILRDRELRGANPQTRAWIRQNFRWDEERGYIFNSQAGQTEAVVVAPRRELESATIDLHGSNGTRWRAEITGTTPEIVLGSYPLVDRAAARVAAREMQELPFIPEYRVIERRPEPDVRHQAPAERDEPTPEPEWAQAPTQPAPAAAPAQEPSPLGPLAGFERGQARAAADAGEDTGKGHDGNRQRKQWHERRLVRFAGKSAASLAILGVALTPAYKKTMQDFADITGSKQPAADLAATWHVDGIISNIPVLGSVVEK